MKLSDEAFVEFLSKKLESFYHLAQTKRIVINIPLQENLRKEIKGMHWHLFPELFFQIGGSSLFSMPSEKIAVKKGEMYLLPRGVPHSEVAYEDEFENLVVMTAGQITSIHLSIAKKNESPRVSQIYQFNDPKAHRVMEYLDDIVAAQIIGNKTSKDVVNSLCLVYIDHLLTLIQKRNLQPNMMHPKVYQCKRIVLTHLHMPELSVPKIANMISCSPDYLSSLFQKESGIALISYLRQQRLSLACDLLRSTTLDISQVARECGYSAAGYFTKVFKKEIGEGPKAFRKRNLLKMG